MNDYPRTIEGLRFLGQSELPQVSTCWEYQTVPPFPEVSARRLIVELPEDLEITFFDPDAGSEEAWIRVRRVESRYLVQSLRHGRFGGWTAQLLSAVVASLRSSPLVKEPSGEFASFRISTIPEHQRNDHFTAASIQSRTWKRLPLPARKEPLGFSAQYTPSEAKRILLGLSPTEMEDKWFIYFEEGWLYFHRSWTGACIYGVRLDESPAGAQVVDSWVNRDPAQYRGTDIEYDRKLVGFLIDALLLKKETAFPLPVTAERHSPGVFQHHAVGRGYRETKVSRNAVWASLACRIKRIFGR